MTTIMPEDVFFGKVVFRAIRAVADQSDADRQPDAIPATGYVLFTPATNPLKALTPGPTTVVKDAIRCNLGPDGYMIDPEGEAGVWLVAGDYKVTYAIDDASLEGHTIRVTEEYDDEAPLDLTIAIEPSGSLNTSQYQQLLALIQASGIPDAPINGQLYVRKDGSWVVIPDVDLSLYSTTVETESMIAQAISEIVFPESGVPEAPEDGGAYLRKSATWVPLLGEVSGSSYRGVWDSTTEYKAGDTVLAGGDYWGANLDNVNSIPSDDVTYTLTGDDGYTNTYYWGQLHGGIGNKEMLHPVRFTEAIRLGGFRVHWKSGWAPGTVFSVAMTDTLPAGLSSLPLIVPANIAAPIALGGDNYQFLFDSPINLEAEKDYWIWLRAENGTLDGVAGDWNGYSYSGNREAPVQDVTTYVRNDGGNWAKHGGGRHIYMGTFTASLVEWDRLSYDPYQIESPDKSVETMVSLTPAEFAAIATKDPKRIYLVDDQIYLGDQLLSPGVLSEAPSDGTPYVRQDALWAPFPEIDVRGLGKFRGVWSTLESNGIQTITELPANGTESGVVQYRAPIHTGAPAQGTVAVVGGYAAPNGSGQGQLNLIAPATTVKAKIMMATQGAGWGLNQEVQVNGGTVIAVSDTNFTLREVTILAGQTLSFVNKTFSGYWGYIEVAYIEWFRNLENPYMSGDVVVHESRLWQSDLDNNSNTPGVSGWTEVPLTSDIADVVGLQTALDAKALKTQVVSNKTTSYTPVLSDENALIVFDSATDVNLTVPTDASVAFPIGARIDVMTKNAGMVSAVAVTPGTTLVVGSNGIKTAAQYSAMSITKIAANTWVVVGDVQ